MLTKTSRTAAKCIPNPFTIIHPNLLHPVPPATGHCSAALRRILNTVLRDKLLEGRLAGADERFDLVAVLEHHEGGHGGDTELLREFRHLVDVDLDESDVLVVVEVGEPAQGTGQSAHTRSAQVDSLLFGGLLTFPGWARSSCRDRTTQRSSPGRPRCSVSENPGTPDC